VSGEVAPSRVRGLKHLRLQQCALEQSRTFTGAWIETKNTLMKMDLTWRRTFTGAWIETDLKCP